MFDFDKENWHTTDINVDSLWIINKRDSSGKHANVYHGNFIPQIPYQLIKRYTKENDIVLDIFSGSGTTLFECENLKRNFIGFDLNDEIIKYTKSQMTKNCPIKYFLFNCDNTNTKKFNNYIESALLKLNTKKVDLLIAHPPYLDIVKFTNKKEDLSNISDLKTFLKQFTLSMSNSLQYLKTSGYFAVIIGDVYKNSEIIPLSFYVMDAIKRSFKCKLKGIIIKNIEGNRGKIGSEGIWKYRALKSDYYLFKHEYIFVFKYLG